MGGAGDIRAGGAYVEIYANDMRLQGDLARVAARLTGLVGVSRMLFSGAAVAMANVNLQLAAESGNLESIYQAQLKMQDAVGDMLQQIPLIGHAIRMAYESFGDKTQLEQALKNLKELEDGILRMEQNARKWARETAVERAKLKGATAGEVAQIEAGFKNEDINTAVRDAFAVNAKAQTEAGEAFLKARRLQSAADSYKQYGFKGLGQLKQNDADAALAAAKALQEKADQAAADLAKVRSEAAARKDTITAAADKAVADEKEKAAGDAAEKQQKFEQEYTDALADETGKRVNAVQRQYAELIAEAQKYGRDAAALEKARDAEIAGIQKEAADRVTAEQERRKREAERVAKELKDSEAKYADAITDDMGRSINEVRRKYAELIDEAQKRGRDIAPLENARDKEIADIRNKPVEQRQNMMRDLQREAAGITEQQRRSTTKERLDDLLRTDPAAGMEGARAAAESARTQAKALWESVKKAITDAFADGVLTPEEKDRIESARDSWRSAVGDFDAANSLLGRAGNKVLEFKEDMEARVTSVGWRVAGLGLGSTVNDRAAKAAEETARNTRDIKDKVADLSGEFI